MLAFLKKIFGSVDSQLQEALKKGAIILDVRTPIEFSAGHIEHSKNIPLDQVKSKAAEISRWKKPVIVVCRSGNRSRMAIAYLKPSGIELYNGGGWTDLKKLMK